MKHIYLDYAAATPVDPAVSRVMQLFFKKDFGNPSSTHSFGRVARAHIDASRTKLAKLLHCAPRELYFTHSGTEANNISILGTARANKHLGNHIITSSVEHDSVFEACKQLEKEGFRVTYLPVDSAGRVDLQTLRKALTKKTILVSIIAAQNEVGTVQLLAELVRTVKTFNKNIIVHTDACQYAGSHIINFSELKVDALTLNAAKIYGPKGVGLLFLRKGVACAPLMFGGGQEYDMVPGTENVMNIVGLAKAYGQAVKRMKSDVKNIQIMRGYLWNLLRKNIKDIQRNGDVGNATPHILHVTFPGYDTQTLLIALDLAGMAVSSGSACASGSVDHSRVLQAMGIAQNNHHAHVRFSIGRYTTKGEINDTVRRISGIMKNFRHSERKDLSLRPTSGLRMTPVV